MVSDPAQSADMEEGREGIFERKLTFYFSIHLFSSEESSLELIDNGITFDLSVLEPGHGREEVSRIGETIRTYYIDTPILIARPPPKLIVCVCMCVWGGGDV